MQLLVVDKSFTSSRYNQKRIKLTSELNCYYNIGLKLIKICTNNGNKVNNIIPNPLTWWLKVGQILYLILAKITLNIFSILAISFACK